MKIVNVTLVVSTGANGETTETQASDPNFAVGHSYVIPELGEGAGDSETGEALWTVTEVSEPSTNFVGGKTIATTRVQVVPAAPGSLETTSHLPSAKASALLPSGRPPRPIPKPTQKQRHTPK